MYACRRLVRSGERWVGHRAQRKSALTFWAPGCRDRAGTRGSCQYRRTPAAPRRVDHPWRNDSLACLTLFKMKPTTSSPHRRKFGWGSTRTGCG